MKLKLTTFLVFACIYCHGQSTNSISVIPPSPTSREFDKYITYDVSLSNGIPEISIPLYEIRLGNTSIPLTLKYHASGIKFAQQSGEVGLGWVLDPGCRISRTIYGRPDEFFDKPTSPNPGADFATNQARDYYLAQFEDLGMSYPHGASRLDGEFDLFTYSLPSINGSFVIEDRQLNKIRQISHTNSSISLNRSSDRSIAYFDMKDGNGISYRLGKNLSANNSFLERNPNYTSAPSSWMLTDMVDPLGNYARFNYADYTESDPVWFKKSLLIHQGGNGGNIGEERSFAYLDYIPASSLRYEVKRMSTIDTKDQLLTFFRASTTGILDSITIRGNSSNNLLKTIRFVYDAKPGNNFLKSIIISGTDSSVSQVYKFDYYNQGFSGGSLDGNFIPDYWGYYKQSTSSQYYFPNFDDVNYLATSPGSSDLFFQIKNPAYDGLNMIDRNSSSVVPDFFSLKKITYPTGGSTAYEYEPNKYNGYRDDRSGSSDKFVGIRIKRISSNDNVKGETLVNEYKYGINESGFGAVEADIADKRYFAKENLFLQTDVVYSNSIPFLETTYQTTIAGDMSAFSSAPVSYDQVSQYMINKEALVGQPTNNGKIVYDFSAANESSWTGFSTNNSFNVTFVQPGINNGHSLTSAPRRFHQYYISLQSSWNKAMLLNKSVYSLDNNQYQLISKENYVYADTLIKLLTGLKVIPFVKLASNYSSAIDYYNSGINSFYNYSTYEISCGNKILKKKTTTNYQNGEVKAEVRYNYNEDLQLAREELINSDGSSLITKYRYPIDYGTISGLDDISKGIKGLKTDNILNPVIEKWAERKPLSGPTRLVNAVLTSYKPDRPLPDKVFVVEAAEPITNFRISTNLNGVVEIDNRYLLKLNLNKYDLNGRLLEQKIENGLTTSYAWSYSGQYPIAEIKNAKIAEFAFSNFETPGDHVPEENPENWMVTTMPGTQSTFYSWFSGAGYTGNRSFRGPALVSKSIPQGDYMLSFFAKGNGTVKINNVDQLITSSDWQKYNFPLSAIKGVTITNLSGVLIDDLLLSRKDIQMTSYTHEPLVGLTSETDAKGMVTYYEYDSAHRLKTIKDHKRQIIKSFNYNYRPASLN